MAKKYFPQKAMVLAAGLGKRLYPLTATLPKPLIKVNGISLLDSILTALEEVEIKEIVINLHYLSDLIYDFIQKRKNKALIHFSYEAILLETGGGVVKALPYFDNAPFFIVAGDILWKNTTQNPFFALAEAWNDQEMDALLLMKNCEEVIGYKGSGDFILKEEGEEKHSLYRPSHLTQFPFLFASIWMAHPRFFKNPPSEIFSNAALFFTAAEKEKGKLERIKGIPYNGVLFHINELKDLKNTEAYYRQIR